MRLLCLYQTEYISESELKFELINAVLQPQYFQNYCAMCMVTNSIQKVVKSHGSKGQTDTERYRFLTFWF